VLAVPYRVAEDGGGAGGAVAMEPLARTRFAEWPAGGAWGTVEDQARWLMAAVNGGRLGSVELLQPATLAEMYRRQYDPGTGPMGGGWGGEAAGYGLAWWVSERGGEPIIAHSGSVGGYTAFLHGVPGRRLGVAMLTNGNRAHPHLVRLSYLAADLLVREGLAPVR
jgi:CubicO group peptidase (beta-lactamase class C family)